jgi:citronellol/citronellal dehydrogenase
MGKVGNKVAIVIGASRGIGKAVAQMLAAEGAKVVCAGRSLNEGDQMLPGSLNTTVSEIKQAGGTALAVKADVADEESCR